MPQVTTDVVSKRLRATPFIKGVRFLLGLLEDLSARYKLSLGTCAFVVRHLALCLFAVMVVGWTFGQSVVTTHPGSRRC